MLLFNLRVVRVRKKRIIGLMAITVLFVSVAASSMAAPTREISSMTDPAHPKELARTLYKKLLRGEEYSLEFNELRENFEAQGLEASGEISVRFVGGESGHWNYWVGTDFYDSEGTYRMLSVIMRVGAQGASLHSVVDPDLIENWAHD